MARKSKARHSKDRRRRKVEEVRRDRKGPSSSTVRYILLVAAIVTIVGLAIVLAYTQQPDGPDDNGNGNDHPPVNRAPVPKASANRTEVFIFEDLTLDGSRSYDPDIGDSIVNFTWEVHQDWLTGQVIHKFYGRKVNVSFDRPGALYIVLKVKDGYGSTNTTVSASQYGGLTIMVKTKEPVAVAGDDVTTVVGRDVYFDADKSHDEDGEIVKYHWDFGDGNSTDGAFVSHIYAMAGTYTVTLTVTDNFNEDGTDTLTVVVT